MGKYKQRDMFEMSKKMGRKGFRRNYAAKSSEEDSVSEGVRQIPDGPHYYPESVVIYTRFRSFPLRALFAYLREKEHYFQKDIKSHSGLPISGVMRGRLQEVESHLIWMVSNLTRAGNANGEYEDENWT
ncbi:hypothetical protein UFOVP1625_40 [uncultured Caudovirales phage]|uniref:Uncharacterized protein n=1 Tax=uncultured Caudovirales phage TaxID=2100421 RepID=A0A6J5T151_9CAUD|nr:hypothetical protein UFOVP1625_40 [uncultured Caudovirales phage]